MKEASFNGRDSARRKVSLFFEKNKPCICKIQGL